MSGAYWSKWYGSPAALDRARAHHAWLAAAGLLVPALVAVDAPAGRLVLKLVPGAHARTRRDLDLVAGQLGSWSERLRRRELARTTASHSLPISGGRLPGFLDARRATLSVAAAAPDALVGRTDLARVEAVAARAAPGVYKDTNVRNVLIEGDRAVHVDFDDVTLAPAGYDLAKLLVSWAMTHGERPPVERCLDRYNAAAGSELCASAELALWLELNHVLTHRYVRAGHYAYSWSSVRTRRDRALVDAALGQASVPRPIDVVAPG